MNVLGFVTSKGRLIHKMDKLDIHRNFSNLEREAWRVFLMTDELTEILHIQRVG